MMSYSNIMVDTIWLGSNGMTTKKVNRFRLIELRFFLMFRAVEVLLFGVGETSCSIDSKYELSFEVLDWIHNENS